MGKTTVAARAKAAGKYRAGKTTERKPPVKGKTTVKPTRILGRNGIQIKKTF